MWALQSRLSPKTLRRELGQFDLQFRFALGDEVGNELAGDGAKAEAEHGVAGGNDGVLQTGDRADAGKTVRGGGAQAGPRLDSIEITLFEGRKKSSKRLDDALHTFVAD